jgi:hypothetical protein
MNHEVVLSDGSIVEANPQKNADLHRALKGGNNNFGIVTRFDMKAIPQGPMWGGGAFQTTKEPSFAWFQTFANSSTTDLDAAIMYSSSPIFGQWASGGLVTHLKNESNPSAFKGLLSPTWFPTTGMTTLNTLAQMNAIGTPSGSRTAWATFTFANSASFMRTVIDLAASESKAMPFLSSGVTLIFQPLWKAPRAKVLAETGGNVLGLDDQDDLVIVLASVYWMRPADDVASNDGLKKFVEKATALAKTAGVHSRYVYLNYAAEFQDPISGYGEKNVADMIATSKKYDPIQLFQKQVPGGFKLRHRDRDWF